MEKEKAVWLPNFGKTKQLVKCPDPYCRFIFSLSTLKLHKHCPKCGKPLEIK